LVTIDAMGCQKAIAQKIVDQGGHYLDCNRFRWEGMLTA
jgi:predicted transposase YbfD/YdcC